MIDLVPRLLGKLTLPETNMEVDNPLFVDSRRPLFTSMIVREKVLYILVYNTCQVETVRGERKTGASSKKTTAGAASCTTSSKALRKYAGLQRRTWQNMEEPILASAKQWNIGFNKTCSFQARTHEHIFPAAMEAIATRSLLERTCITAFCDALCPLGLNSLLGFSVELGHDIARANSGFTAH